MFLTIIFFLKYILDIIIFSDGSDYKATLSDVIYRCRLDEENFADFTIEIIPGPEFRVEKFQKSIYVVEQEDLKVECDIVKQNNSEIGNNLKDVLAINIAILQSKNKAASIRSSFTPLVLIIFFFPF